MKLSIMPPAGHRSIFSVNAQLQCAAVARRIPCCITLKTASSWRSRSKYGVVSKVGKLREKWREFQGIKNWEGLLDPLDDGLRDEILRYGEFVEAAYRSFDFDTASPGYGTCLYPDRSMLDDCGIAGTGYDVARGLVATCGVRLPAWTDRIPSYVSTRSSWIGYVAVCSDEREIARLGRRDVVIAYRGTATCMEWVENLRATLAYLPPEMAPDDRESMVQTGFLSLYTSRTATSPSLQDAVLEEISRILSHYAGEPLSITVTGHSLGAALATLTAHDITTKFADAPLVSVVSFGGPRVGNASFRRQLERNRSKVLRIVNSDDPITKVPGFVVQGAAETATGLSGWLQKQWMYAEVGKELRLSSRDCPDLRKTGNVATCHDLKTYLHLVGSNCPLRARVLETANRREWYGQRQKTAGDNYV